MMGIRVQENGLWRSLSVREEVLPYLEFVSKIGRQLTSSEAIRSGFRLYQSDKKICEKHGHRFRYVGGGCIECNNEYSNVYSTLYNGEKRGVFKSTGSGKLRKWELA